jgi:phage recombination protein Bet
MSKELITTAQMVTDAELTMHLENLGLLKDLTNGEKNTYLQIAKAYNLNPFKREIHVSKYGNQMSIITGYEVYIKRAERTGQLDGWSVVTEGTVAANDLKAIVTIHRKDRSHPFTWEAIYSEYVQLKDGKPNKFWQKATTMIKKVAISQAFRLCFSDELGGMPYTSDEMENTQDTTPVSITNGAPAATYEKWEATAEQWHEAETLITNSTLDENQKFQASNRFSNCRAQADWDKNIDGLRTLQLAS